MIIVSLLAGLLGLALLGAAVWTFYNQRNKAVSGITATGTVVDLTREMTTPGSTGVYCPVVDFTLPSGEKITFTSDYGTRPASHKVGQSVTVRYDPDDPQKAEVDPGPIDMAGSGDTDFYRDDQLLLERVAAALFLDDVFCLNFWNRLKIA